MFSESLGNFEQTSSSDSVGNFEGCGAHGLNNFFQTALGYVQRAFGIAKEQQDNLEEQAYTGLGIAYLLKNQFQTARHYFDKALEITQEANNTFGQTLANILLGDSYRCDGQIQAAVPYYNTALKTAREQRYKFQEAWALCGLGVCCRAINDIIQLQLNTMREPYKLQKNKDISIRNKFYILSLRKVILETIRSNRLFSSTKRHWKFPEKEKIRKERHKYKIHYRKRTNFIIRSKSKR